METIYNAFELSNLLTENQKEVKVETKASLNQKGAFSNGTLCQDTKSKAPWPDFNSNYNLNLASTNSNGLYCVAEADRFSFINGLKIMD